MLEKLNHLSAKKTNVINRKNHSSSFVRLFHEPETKRMQLRNLKIKGWLFLWKIICLNGLNIQIRVSVTSWLITDVFVASILLTWVKKNNLWKQQEKKKEIQSDYISNFSSDCHFS